MKLTELHQIRENAEISVRSIMGDVPDNYQDTIHVSNSYLTSLEGSPTTVHGGFYCNSNSLVTLKDAPVFVGGRFECHRNLITSLEGLSISIGADFSCYKNRLTSLRNVHKHIKKMGGYADFSDNPIKSHVLGLLLINGIRSVFLDNIPVTRIINKHLEGDRDIFACQEELIEAGFEEFAQL